VSDPQRPDLAIEVIWTSGGLDKREIYRALGVREVWFWRKGRLTVHALRPAGYEEIAGRRAAPSGPGLPHAANAEWLDRTTV
jgi:Uma2 family endonuclease